MCGKQKPWGKYKNDRWGPKFLEAQNITTYNDFFSGWSMKRSESQISETLDMETSKGIE